MRTSPLKCRFFTAPIRLILSIWPPRWTTLTISRLTSGLFGGTLDGTASLTHGTMPTGGLTLSIKNADMREVAISTSGAAQVTGTLNYKTSLNTAGRSEFDLISGLQGSGSISVSDGTIEGLDLPAVSDQLKQLDRSVDFLLLAQRAIQGGTTPFDSLTATYKIINGVLQSEDISLKSRSAEARGTAVVNLPPQEMDVRTQSWLSEHPNSPPIGLRLTGPLDNPRQILDVNKLQNYVLQRVIERGILRQFNKKKGSNGESVTKTVPEAAPSEPVEKLDPRKALRDALKELLTTDMCWQTDRTKTRSALERLPLREASTSDTSPFIESPLAAAICLSASQKASSSDTDVTCPKTVTVRLRMRDEFRRSETVIRRAGRNGRQVRYAVSRGTGRSRNRKAIVTPFTSVRASRAKWLDYRRRKQFSAPLMRPAPPPVPARPRGGSSTTASKVPVPC